METMNDTTQAAHAPGKSPSLGSTRWTDWILPAIVVALMLWLYVPVFRSWYGQWFKDESYYSHGILVPFISAFVVWLKRSRLAEIEVKPCALGYVLVVASLIVNILMVWAGATNPQGLVFPILVTGLVLVLLGKQMTLELWFPLAYLFFMCVLPGDILTKLSFRIQLLSTEGGTLILKALTFDAVRNGTAITLPNIDVLVGAPCSGFRLLISLFAFSSLFAYLKEGPLWGRLTLVAVTLPLSIIVNSIRIALIAIVGEYFGYEVMHAFHDYSGYLVLVLAFIFLWFFAKVVKCPKFNSMLLSS